MRALANREKAGAQCVSFPPRHWPESIAAAERSIARTKGVNASDWFFLAMAQWQMRTTWPPATADTPSSSS
jgi:hypothetical protein